MVSIPVRLFKAARRERIRFRHLYQPEPEDIPANVAPSPEEAEESQEETQPVPLPTRIHAVPESVPRPDAAATRPLMAIRNVPLGEAGAERIQRSQILKGYEVEKDRYVTFAPQELADLRPKTSSELNISEFVRLSEIDPLFFDTSYYVTADRDGEKPYALLFRSLQETGYVAIGALAMHGREHAVAIRPGQKGLILHTLFYAAEVRGKEEYQADLTLVHERELQLATRLVGVLAVRFDPATLRDTFEERLRDLIEARARNSAPATLHHEIPAPAPATDLLEALRKSLEIVRKPASSEKAAPKRSAPRKRDGRKRLSGMTAQSQCRGM